MSDKVKFNAEDKKVQGTSSARAFRRSGMIPAIIYGGPVENKAVAIPENEFEKERKRGAFTTRLIDIMLDGKVITTIARAVQFHPVSGRALHIDFQQVNENSTIKVNVHVRIVNEDKCPGLKVGGVVNLVHRSIPVICPVGNIPEHIDVDISGLQIGENKHISELKLPSGVSPVDSSDFTVVSIGGNIADEEEASGAASGQEQEGSADKGDKA